MGGLLLAAVLVPVMALAIGFFAFNSAVTPTLDLASPPSPLPELTTEERAYYDYVAPRVRELSAQTRALGEAAAAKSRNLLDIRARGARITTLIQEINQYGETSGTPARFAPAAAAYRSGAGSALAAMREAQQGFIRFDWDRVAAAVPVFADGAAQLDVAAEEMDQAGGQPNDLPGTPPG